MSEDLKVINQDMFRSAWGNFATGVSVITTIESNGEIHGMTANGIASVSLEPMLVMVAIGHSTNTHDIIKSSGKYGINILSDQHVDIGKHFASSIKEFDPDILAKFSLTTNGIPFLKGALASMDCRVVKQHTEGDHTIFIGEVLDVVVNEGQPILFHKGKWIYLP